MCQVNGNLTIRAGGTVIVDHGGLAFAQNTGFDGVPGTADDRVYTLIIEDGGKLILRNSTLTVSLDQLNDFPSLGVIVRNGGVLEAYDSALMFPGQMVVDDSTLTMWRSSISGVEGVEDYCNTTYFPVEVFSAAPVLLFVSATVNMYDSALSDVYEAPITGMDMTGLFDHAYSFAQDRDNMTGWRMAVDYYLSRMASGVDADLDTTEGNVLGDLTMDDEAFYIIAQDQTMWLSGIDTAGLVFNYTDNIQATLYVEYYTDPGYAGSDNFQIQLSNGAVIDTGVGPSATEVDPTTGSPIQETVSYDLDTMSSLDLYGMNIGLDNNDAGTVYINKIWVELELTLNTYANITLAGSTQFTAVNSYIGVDFDNDRHHNSMVLMDQSMAYLYGVSVDERPSQIPELPSDRQPAFVTVNKEISVLPSNIGVNDTTNELLGGITSVDNIYYTVGAAELMNFDAFNTSGLTGPISGAILTFTYLTEIGFSQNNYLQWSTGSLYRNTSIRPSLSPSSPSVATFDLYGNGVTTITQLENLDIQYVNGASAGLYADSLSVEVTLSPTVYIYRWANYTVVDSQGLPVLEAEIRATSQVSGQEAFYYTSEGVQAAPAAEVLAYLGKTETNYNVTNSYGKASIPYLSEEINGWSLNARVTYAYKIDVSYLNATGALFVNETSVSFYPYYPNLTSKMWQTMTVNMTALVLDRPDLYVVSLMTSASPLYQGDTVQIEAVIGNRGSTSAANIPVNITGYANGTLVSYETSAVIESLGPGATTTMTVYWANVPYGVNIVSVSIDKYKVLLEERRTNNEMSVQVTVLQNLADLSITSDDITFNPQPASTSESVTATISIHNTDGRVFAANVTVEVYVGAKNSGGQLVGSSVVNVPAGGGASAMISWTPSQIGTYPIYVYLNSAGSIMEYSYTNNEASKDITILFGDHDADIVVSGTNELTLPSGPITINGNITVRDSGVLVLDATALTMFQARDDQYRIVVLDSGTLVLNNAASLKAGYKIAIYAYNDGRIFINDSSVQPTVRIVMADSTYLETESSQVSGSLTASSTSSIVAYNSTFGAWKLSGAASADVTSVSISSLSIYDSAVVDHSRWVKAMVKDGNGYALPGATVDLYNIVSGSLYDSKASDVSGMALFKAYCDEITASGSHYTGSYKIQANFQTYSSGPISTLSSQPDPYVVGQALARADRTEVLNISGALPDLDPPIYATPTEVYRGQEVKVSTVISNNGVVDAYDVVLMFNNSGVTFSTVVIDVLMPGQTVPIDVYWTAEYPLGDHTISVMVDPSNQIKELNENDNYNSTAVTVLGIAELSIVRSNVTFNPSEVSIGKNITIMAYVYNSGDIAAEDVTVKFYATAPGENQIYLGKQNITYLGKGTSGMVAINWNPLVAGDFVILIVVDEEQLINENDRTNNILEFSQTVLDYPDLRVSYITFYPASPVSVNTQVEVEALVINAGQTAATSFVVRFSVGTLTTEVEVESLGAGESTVVSALWYAAIGADLITQDWTFYAEANPDHLIEEMTYGNNNASQVITVFENRPDLMFPSPVTVTLNGTAVDSASVGENITISTTVRNSGTNVATGALIVFYAVDVDGNTFVIGTVTKTIGAGQSTVVSYSWLIDASMALGTATLAINANPNLAIVESNTSNDQVNIEFLIDAPNLVVKINSLGGKALVPGTTVYVSGTVTNFNSTLPANNTLVVLYFMKDGVMVGQPFNATTNKNGQFTTGIFVPATADGQYRLYATTTVGEKTQSAFRTVDIQEVNEGGVPWWIYLLIIALVSAVIIGFSAYLYKYGLGKMVECGECGALIPESSKHCPKCGVEFEAGTAKCSECGAWIPSNSTACPECGAKFITEAIVEEEDAYIKKMREQYEGYVDIFREEAKKVLGKKYSDAKFPDWWKKQPSYISFEGWVTQEEQKKKAGGQACPVCGTLNPRGAATCHKCGSVLELMAKAPESEKKAEEEKARPLRRVVRRPIEKKVEKAPEDKSTEEAKPPEEKTE